MSKNKSSVTLPSHIDETKVRLIAAGVFIVTLLYTITGHWIFPLFLVADFVLRGFDYGKISPLAQLADWIRQRGHIAPKPIFYLPKRFAARIGLVFATALLVLDIFSVYPFAVAGILLLFSALEAVAGICAGCYAYSLLQPFLQEASTAPLPVSASDDKRPVKEITVQVLKQWQQDEILFQFIDVREPHEYEIAHLGAKLIPLGDILALSDQVRTDIPVVIHCRSGVRSAKAIRLLEHNFGWDNLYNLKGGILAYQADTV